MPSTARKKWESDRAQALDEIESAHRHIGGTGRGRRFATQQVNRAYATLLSSEFQAFCRDLHTECIQHLTASIQPSAMRLILDAEFKLHRKLDQGNPNPGNIGSDFNRFGIEIWKEVKKRYVDNSMRHDCLTDMNVWRNAIAHNDFAKPELNGRTTVYLSEVRRWRNACNHLAQEFESVLGRHIQSITGKAPW